MIDFACKRFDLKEVIRCSLDLTKTEFGLVEYLVNSKKEVTTLNLSNGFHLGLSTTQKTIKNFMKKD